MIIMCKKMCAHSSRIKQNKIHDDNTHSLGWSCYVIYNRSNTQECSTTWLQSTQSILIFNPRDLKLGFFNKINQAYGGPVSEYSWRYDYGVLEIKASFHTILPSQVKYT